MTEKRGRGRPRVDPAKKKHYVILGANVEPSIAEEFKELCSRRNSNVSRVLAEFIQRELKNATEMQDA